MLEAFGIHVRERQDLTSARILHNGGNEAVVFLPVDFRELHGEIGFNAKGAEAAEIKKGFFADSAPFALNDWFKVEY